jgi:hypothetical protein
MVLLRYIATVIPALSAAAALELVFAFPRQIIFWGLAWLIITLVVHALLCGREIRSPSFWQFAIPPITLFVTAAAYSLLIQSPVVRHLLAIVLAVLLFAIYWNLYIFIYQPVRYLPHSLEHLSVLCNLLAVFFGATGLFGLRTYLGLNALTIVALAFAGSALLVQQSFWVSKLKFRDTAPYLLIIPLLESEAAAALYGLPVGYATSGAVFTLSYYCLLGMVRRSLRGTYTRASAWRYAIVTLGGVALVFFSAKWF